MGPKLLKSDIGVWLLLKVATFFFFFLKSGSRVAAQLYCFLCCFLLSLFPSLLTLSFPKPATTPNTSTMASYEFPAASTSPPGRRSPPPQLAFDNRSLPITVSSEHERNKKIPAYEFPSNATPATPATSPPTQKRTPSEPSFPEFPERKSPMPSVPKHRSSGDFNLESNQLVNCTKRKKGCRSTLRMGEGEGEVQSEQVRISREVSGERTDDTLSDRQMDTEQADHSDGSLIGLGDELDELTKSQRTIADCSDSEEVEGKKKGKSGKLTRSRSRARNSTHSSSSKVFRSCLSLSFHSHLYPAGPRICYAQESTLHLRFQPQSTRRKNIKFMGLHSK